MKRLHTVLAATIGWLFVLYNVERLHEPLNIASFAYGFIAVICCAAALSPTAHRTSFARLCLIPLPVYLALKLALGYSIAGRALPLTVTEIIAIEISLYLVHRMAREIKSVRDAVERSMVRHLKDPSLPFDAGQSEIYREIRRARRHGRPLALLSIAPKRGSFDTAGRIIQRLERESLVRWINAQLADLLVDEMDDSDIITLRDDHFVTVLPETDRDEAALLAKRLESIADERLGLPLQIGMSSFPDQEITFDKLLESAETEMRARDTEHAEAPIRLEHAPSVAESRAEVGTG